MGLVFHITQSQPRKSAREDVDPNIQPQKKKNTVTNIAEIKIILFCLEEKCLYLHNISRENITFQLASGQLRSPLRKGKWSKWSLAQPALLLQVMF